MGKIGVFGGSFNPPHFGHLLAANEAMTELKLDRMILVPAAIPPHKELPADSPDQRQRLELLQLAVQEFQRLEVSDLELRRAGPSYSVDTLEQLAAQNPKDRLFFLMGTDMFLSLHNWYRPERIAELCTVVVLLRADESDEMEKALHEQEKKLRKYWDIKTVRLHNRHLELSSTQVRRMLAFDCAGAYLPPQVLQVIYREHYYGAGCSRKDLPVEELRRQVTQLLHPNRVAHVMGCSETAEQLARRWGANERDALRAGLLHDITKALTPAQQLILCENYDIIISDFERENPKLLHAKTGAAIARFVFGENEAVCSAICWHTTGRANMSLLEKILYLADYMEPNRDFDGVELLRRQTQTDLDLALCTALNMSMQALKQRNSKIDQNSRQAWEYMNRHFSQK